MNRREYLTPASIKRLTRLRTNTNLLKPWRITLQSSPEAETAWEFIPISVMFLCPLRARNYLIPNCGDRARLKY